ncbi:hypothetical protein C8R43DRAFT_599892 [Mycena crocata]|nr:hypothetical protein C8R43DRAFT_599892 [Mycena crocata]
MAIRTISTALLVVSLFATMVMAQSTISESQFAPSATLSTTPSSRNTMEPRMVAIYVMGTLLSVTLIVLTSYFCCCHASCREARQKRAAGRAGDVESRGAELAQRRGGESSQQNRVDVPATRRSTDKIDRDDDGAASTMEVDAPPKYRES